MRGARRARRPSDAGVGARTPRWLAHADASDPEAAVADDDPVAAHVHQRHESRPKGAMHDQPQPDRANTSSMRRRRRDDATTTSRCTRCRSTTRPAALLPRPRRLCSARRTSSCPRPSPRRCWRRSSAERATKLFCPPTVWISLLRHPRLRRRDLSLAAQGLLRRRRSCRSRCCTSSAAPARGAPVQLLRPDRDVAAGHRPAPGGPGAQGGLGRARGAQRRDAHRRRRGPRRRPPARSARSSTAARTRCSATGATPEKTAESVPRRLVPPGDLGILDEEGYITSSTARRT